MLSHDGETTTPEVFADESNSFQVGPTFSPDGRWLAYFSNEAGGNEKRVLEPILLKNGEGQIRVAHMSVIKVEEYSSLSGQGPWPTGALSKRGIRAQPQHGLVSEKLRIREHRALSCGDALKTLLLPS